MKKLLLLLIINCQLFIFNSLAQIPQSFKYQAVVRDATGILAVNRIVSIRTSILAGNATGNSVYAETQTLSTNDYGVVSLNIGAGTVVSGNFTTISWGANTYFVKTELDITGGSTYIFMGTSQILSVPYALYASKAGSSVADHDTSATNELQNLSIAGKNLHITNGNTVTIPQDSLSIAGHVLGITNGNTVNLPPPQTLSIVGDSMHISNGNTIYLSGAVDLDASPTNELQNLSLSNDTLKISMGNNVVFPHNYDNDTTNELQSLSLTQGTLQLSKANTVHLPDSSATNELQNLTINQGTIRITNGNLIHLPDSTATNELQTLSITNDNITISQGNSLYLNSTKSLQFPEGVVGTCVLFTGNTYIYPNYYTIPMGMNYYVTYMFGSLDNGSTLYQDYYAVGHGLPVLSEGTKIRTSSDPFITGLLVPKTTDIQIVDIELSNSSGISYTVPFGKTFYIKNFDTYLRVNGLDPGAFQSAEQMLIVPAGTVITSLTNYSGSHVTGYLR